MTSLQEDSVREPGVVEPGDPAVLRRDWRRWGFDTSPLRARIAQLRGVQGLMLLVCVVLCAAPVTLAPAPGIDISWVTALNLARQDRLGFGSDLLFTYGPWGYLDSPLAVSRFNLITGILFMVFAVAVAWLALHAALRKIMDPNFAAIACTAVVVVVTPIGGASAILLLGVVLTAIDYVGSTDGRSRAWLPAASAACAALLEQIKFSEGFFLTAAVVATCVFAPRARVRRGAEALVAFVGTTVLMWLLAGQALGDLPRWMVTSFQIARGYSEAMATNYPPHLFSYLLIIAVILTVVGYVASMARSHAWRPTAGVLVLTGIVMYFGFREATGRHDGGHEVYFYVFALPALAWFAGMGRSLLFRSVVLVVAVVLASNNWLYANVSAVRERWNTTTEVLTSGDYKTGYLDAAKIAAQLEYKVPAALLTTLSGHPMAVDGWEATLPWAYGLNWRPAPLFQSYVAYTADLDGINADWLRGSPADQMILRPPQTTIDGRNSLWDPPQYVLAEMCNLRVSSASDGWLLLEKAPNRCGARTAVSAARVEAGQPVSVPRIGASQILTMSFTADSPGLLVNIGRTLNKSFTPLWVTADQTPFRLPKALAGGPLILAVPSAVGWPTQFGGHTSCGQVSFSESGMVQFSVIDVS